VGESELVIRANGMSGHCSCGRDTRFIEVEITGSDGLSKIEKINSCVDCFLDKMFQARILLCLGISPEMVGATSVTCCTGVKLPRTLIPNIGYRFPCVQCGTTYHGSF
jgi:hypothetical protein